MLCELTQKPAKHDECPQRADENIVALLSGLLGFCICGGYLLEEVEAERLGLTNSEWAQKAAAPVWPVESKGGVERTAYRWPSAAWQVEERMDGWVVPQEGSTEEGRRQVWWNSR